METLEIHVNRLRLYACHGVMEQERKVGNFFEVSVSLRCRNTAAGMDDRLESTVNYARVIELVKHEMEIPSKLLENVAGRIRGSLTAEFQEISGGSVTVNKLTPPCGAEVEAVGVTLSC